MFTFEGCKVPPNFQHFLKRGIIFLIRLLHINPGKCIFTPQHQFLSFFPVFPIADQLEIEVPNVKIEYDETLIIGVIFWISR